MEVSIREVTLRDFDQVFGLLKQLWAGRDLDYADMKKVFDHNLNAPDHFYIVAHSGPQIVGYCSLMVKHNLWQQGLLGNVNEMVVEENYRGKGIGKKLMERIIQIAREQNCKCLELESSFHREKAHAFYEELGFDKRAYLFTKIL